MTRWAAPLLLLLPLTSSAEPGVVQSEHSVTVKIESGSLLRARRMEEPGCYATSTRMVWETAVVQAVSGTLSRKKRSGEVITCRFTLTELRAERTGIYGSWSPFVETTVEPVKVTFESRCELKQPWKDLEKIALTEDGVTIDEHPVFQQGRLDDQGVVRHKRVKGQACDSTFWWSYSLSPVEVVLPR